MASNEHIGRMTKHWLAQLNVARSLEPLDAPLLADFVAMLDPINALAERAPGFVWRLKTAAGDPLGLRLLDEDRLIVNFTVWENLEALSDFVYRSAHVEVMRQGRKWFDVVTEPVLVLWWTPAGSIPSLEEAEARLFDLRRDGPTPRAFTIKAPFFPPTD